MRRILPSAEILINAYNPATQFTRPEQSQGIDVCNDADQQPLVSSFKGS